MAKNFPTLASIDFGTSKTCVLVCEMTPEGLEVIGFGETPSHGIRKGSIVNIDSTVMAIKETLEESKGLSNREIDFLIAGVTGSHVEAVSSHGMVAIRDQEVKGADIDRAIEAGSAINIPLDREVIQVVPQSFVVDGQDGINDPLGMYGKRLEVNLQIVTGAVTPLENLRRCLQKAGMKPHQLVSNSLASARAVLRADEKDAGVCVIDIGAATTDICVHQEGALAWIRSLPIGGMHLTNDLAVGLKTNLSDADILKHHYGAIISDYTDEEIDIPGLSGSGSEPRIIPRRMLGTILQPRIDEILTLVRNELSKHGVDEALPSGIVLTGGTANLKGIVESAERVFRLPVRIGRPQGLGGLSDMVSASAYATAVGLLQIGFEQNDELQYFSELYEQQGLRRVRSQVARWLKDFF